MGTLSVRENLRFSANLRLDPRRHSSADKLQRVDALLDQLGLNDCADTKVGHTRMRPSESPFGGGKSVVSIIAGRNAILVNLIRTRAGRF